MQILSPPLACIQHSLRRKKDEEAVGERKEEVFLGLPTIVLSCQANREGDVAFPRPALFFSLCLAGSTGLRRLDAEDATDACRKKEEERPLQHRCWWFFFPFLSGEDEKAEEHGRERQGGGFLSGRRKAKPSD